MVRFAKDGEAIDLWIERVEHVPHLWTRKVHSPPERLSTDWFDSERRFVEMQSQYLRDGWRRVHDPARELDVDGEPRDLELDARLLADPDDTATALVYADWLQHRDHPRGQLIVVQHALATRPHDAELRAREAELFEEIELLGGLAGFVRTFEFNEPGIALEWRHGFIRRARIDGFHDRGDSEHLLWELLRHPSARVLRELEIGCHHPGDQDNRLVVDMVLRAGPTPPLRRLVVGDFDESAYDGIDISRAPIGDLTGLGARYPLLDTVELKGNYDVELGELDLPRARRFALRTSTMQNRTLAAIAAAPWPALEDLELWFGDREDGYGAECGEHSIAALLARSFPKLRTLRLMNADFTDEVVPVVAKSPLAAQLETLDFTLGTLSDAGARVLAQQRAAFPQLARLAVYDCALTADGLAVLRDAGFPVDETPSSSHEAQSAEWRRASPQSYTRWQQGARTQKNQRFVTVSE